MHGASLASRVREGDAVLARVPQPAGLPANVLWIEAPADAAAYGHDLYARLRALDSAACRRILVETPPTRADWSAVIDRLGRAAVGSGADEET